MKHAIPLLVTLAVCSSAVLAKLPAPSDEAKAKAAEAAAKTAHAGKVDNFKLCQSMDRVAAAYLANAKKAGKDPKPTATPVCEDPGAFVYNPPGAASAPAAPAVAAAPPAKK
jgi:hypothetical protein